MLQLVELLLAALPVAALPVVRQQLVLQEQLVAQVHSLGQMSVQQQVQNFELAQILELGESHPLVNQLQVLQAL
jgi:hypothetical protein